MHDEQSYCASILTILQSRSWKNLAQSRIKAFRWQLIWTSTTSVSGILNNSDGEKGIWLYFQIFRNITPAIKKRFWCRIHLWFRLMGVCKQSRWRHSVTEPEPSQDGGYALLWQRYDNNKMVAMRYYGNVMITTMSQHFLHLQQYSHRLNLLYVFFCITSEQSWTATKRGSPGWGLGEELTNPHCKKTNYQEMLHRASEVDWFFGPGPRLKDTIKRDVNDRGSEGIDWINLAEQICTSGLLL